MELSEILDWHFSHYPLLQAEDIIKLIYQGVFGPGHLHPTTAELTQALLREIEQCAKYNKNSAETEPLDPNGLLIRVNLAPIADFKEKRQLLIKALIGTIHTFTPKPELFLPRIKTAQEWAQEHLPNQAERIELYKTNLKSPPHHSQIYIQTYRPAYRVILSRFWLSSPRI